MFKQFVQDISGNQVYLITSLAMFLVFFIIVALLLFRLKKSFTQHMVNLPLEDSMPKTDNLQL